jgi:uncharacterized protein (UPF0264 family)
MPQGDLTPELLVSVRDAVEAEAALGGGADLIDVKEPARGALGRADDATITAVIQRVAGRRPVSAALGELTPDSRADRPAGLRYVKWGLAGWGTASGWQQQLRDMYRPHLRSQRLSGIVLVAYADWRNAAAPPVEDVFEFVRQFGTVVLLDTFDKVPGRTLLDYLPAREIVALCRWCQAVDIKVALAGSLGVTQLLALREACPDWFAVRGAACADGHRAGPISAARVCELKRLLAKPITG